MHLRRDALYACYRRLEGPLYNVLYRMLWQAEDCQDVMHDAFVRVWKRRKRVDAATLDNLVWTTALNLARNRLRHRALWRVLPLDTLNPASSHPSSSPEASASQREVRRALEALPQASREVLLLSEFSGLRGADIAAMLGIPAGTVASRKHHALRRLRQLLGESSNA